MDSIIFHCLAMVVWGRIGCKKCFGSINNHLLNFRDPGEITDYGFLPDAMSSGDDEEDSDGSEETTIDGNKISKYRVWRQTRG